MTSKQASKKIFVSDDKSRLDIKFIHDFLSRAYWSKGREKSVIEKTMKHSLCFGIYDGGKQIGFARVVSDYTLFAYLFDVFIIEEYRGNGLSKKLLEYILTHPDLKNVKKWMLTTTDAHGLYQKFGFKSLSSPEKLMEKINNQNSK
ncbi:MAG: GNAT family N-acetyltransferase [Ignavibacteriaceae bacterium]